METLTINTQVTALGTIQIEVPSALPPGPVEVVLTVRPRGESPAAPPSWDQLSGLGREVWEGVDAKQYVRELREDREAIA